MMKVRNILPYLIGLLVFAALNVLMLQYHYELWTNPKVGFWSVFHKHLCMSGFDPHTYVTVSQWRPSWTMLRHPLLAIYCWPLSELNAWIKSEFHINGAILIIGALWTLLSTLSWAFLYKIMTRLLSLNMKEALLLCTLYFSFAYVMLATFVADHMMITMTLLLATLYMAGKAQWNGKAMSTWKMLAIFFFSTGVTTTNCVKIWLIDVIGRWNKPRTTGFALQAKQTFMHSLRYIPVAALLLGLYVWQENTVMAEEKASIARQEKRHIATDRQFAEKVQKLKVSNEARRAKQLSDSKLFEYTDNSIGRVPSLVHNVFGEGLQLHSSYLLKDVNRNERPAIVRYEASKKEVVSVVNYVVEALVVLLFLAGIWCGRHERFLWMAMSTFLFDMLLHVGLCFALADIYIMTAHWAFVIPIAIAYLLRTVRIHRMAYCTVLSTILLLALWMWAYNLNLIVPYIL